MANQMEQCVNWRTHELSANELAHRRFSQDGWFGGKRHYLAITFYGAFEEFNTRPYHNYESWGFGWFVQSGGEEARSECLECAIEELFRRIDGRNARALQQGDPGAGRHEASAARD